MTQRERILTVLNGGKPDCVPLMMDLSHFYNAAKGREFNLLNSFSKPDKELIDYHKKLGIGYYLPNQAKLYDVKYSDDVISSAETRSVGGREEICWKYETPLGSIQRIRRWEHSSYSWPVKNTGVRTENDLKIFELAMSSRSFIPMVQTYIDWKNEVGDMGIVYLSAGYSALGYLMNYWMGIENTLYAAVDFNKTMHKVVDQINERNLGLIQMFASEYLCEVIVLNDEFHSEVVSPEFFDEWFREYYTQAVKIAHKHGKKVAVIYNGNLRGTLNRVCSCGIDAVNAITVSPMGDLTPEECRKAAGDNVVLSGGISPDLWYSSVPIERFKKACVDWIVLSRHNSAVIAEASNQLPPGADESRIELLKNLTESLGRY